MDKFQRLLIALMPVAIVGYGPDHDFPKDTGK